MSSRRRRATLAGVDQLQAGDQAFATFADDRERWDVLGLFTRLGLARGEKVMLSVDTPRSPDEIAAELAGGADAAREALGRGQLVVSDTPAFRPGSGSFGPATFDFAEFDPAEFAKRARDRLDAAAADGFSGVREGCDLSASLEPFGSVDRLLQFERAVHQQLLAADTRARYTALCQWDERRLGEGTALNDVRSLHPVIILPAPDMLRVTRTAVGILLTGDADMVSRDEFSAALRVLELIRPPEAQPLVLDLTKLSFLDAHSVGSILRTAAGLPAPLRLEIRCRPHHRRMLNILGAHSVPQLTIITRGRLSRRWPGDLSPMTRLAVRDAEALAFAADMYGVQLDQLSALLGDARAARAAAARWKELGYAETARLGPGPAWLWVTRAGLAACGLRYTAVRPGLSRLAHTRAVTSVRLALSATGAYRSAHAFWRGERRIRSRHGVGVKQHLPDGEVHWPSGCGLAWEGECWAIEAELTAKTVARTTAIMREILGRTGDYGCPAASVSVPGEPPRHVRAVYICSAAARPTVLRARESLGPRLAARVEVRDLPPAALLP